MFILVCNSLMKDMESANEFLAGCTLRFISKITDPEIISQVLPTLLRTVQHVHSYVRRHAVLCLHNIYAHHPELIPDAPQICFQLLIADHDFLVQHHSLFMLFETSPNLALSYITRRDRDIQRLNPSLQVLLVWNVRKRCKNQPQEKGQWLPIVQRLLYSSNYSVKYESARTLLFISTNAKIIQAAVESLVQVMATVPSPNVRSVVLDRLIALKRQHRRILSAAIPLTSFFTLRQGTPAAGGKDQTAVPALTGHLAVSSFDALSTEMRIKQITLILELLTPANATEVLPLFNREAKKMLREAQKRAVNLRIKKAFKNLQIQQRDVFFTHNIYASPSPPNKNDTNKNTVEHEFAEHMQFVRGRLLFVHAFSLFAAYLPSDAVAISDFLLEYLADPESVVGNAAVKGVSQILQSLHVKKDKLAEADLARQRIRNLLAPSPSSTDAFSSPSSSSSRSGVSKSAALLHAPSNTNIQRRRAIIRAVLRRINHSTHANVLMSLMALLAQYVDDTDVELLVDDSITSSSSGLPDSDPASSSSSSTSPSITYKASCTASRVVQALLEMLSPLPLNAAVNSGMFDSLPGFGSGGGGFGGRFFPPPPSFFPTPSSSGSSSSSSGSSSSSAPYSSLSSTSVSRSSSSSSSSPYSSLSSSSSRPAPSKDTASTAGRDKDRDTLASRTSSTPSPTSSSTVKVLEDGTYASALSTLFGESNVVDDDAIVQLMRFQQQDGCSPLRAILTIATHPLSHIEPSPSTRTIPGWNLAERENDVLLSSALFLATALASLLTQLALRVGDGVRIRLADIQAVLKEKEKDGVDATAAAAPAIAALSALAYNTRRDALTVVLAILNYLGTPPANVSSSSSSGSGNPSDEEGGSGGGGGIFTNTHPSLFFSAIPNSFPVSANASIIGASGGAGGGSGGPLLSSSDFERIAACVSVLLDPNSTLALLRATPLASSQLALSESFPSQAETGNQCVASYLFSFASNIATAAATAEPLSSASVSSFSSSSGSSEGGGLGEGANGVLPRGTAVQSVLDLHIQTQQLQKRQVLFQSLSAQTQAQAQGGGREEGGGGASVEKGSGAVVEEEPPRTVYALLQKKRTGLVLGGGKKKGGKKLLGITKPGSESVLVERAVAIDECVIFRQLKNKEDKYSGEDMDVGFSKNSAFLAKCLAESASLSTHGSSETIKEDSNFGTDRDVDDEDDVGMLGGHVGGSSSKKKVASPYSPFNSRLTRNSGTLTNAALAAADFSASLASFSNPLKTKTRTVQLSGLSDHIFVEAALRLEQFSAVVEFGFVNRTGYPVREVSLEFEMTAGLVTNDNSIAFSLPASENVIVRQTATFRLSADEMGSVRPLLIYKLPKQALALPADNPFSKLTTSSSSTSTSAVSSAQTLVEQVTQLESISFESLYAAGPVRHPPSLSDLRDAWAIFSWETKIPLVHDGGNVFNFLYRVAEVTNMQLLPYGNPLLYENSSPYISALFFARSIFRQDIIMHVSAEVKENVANKTKTIDGWGRIRSKEKSVALVFRDMLLKLQVDDVVHL